MLTFNKHAKELFQKSPLNFSTLWQWQGEYFRKHKNRSTLKIKIEDQFYFLKKQDVTPWREYFKNFLQGKHTNSDLIQEWKALNMCAEKNISAPFAVAYGKKKCWLRNQSLILMTAIEPSISLETLTLQFSGLLSKSLLQFFIKKTAKIMGKLHHANWHHRDCYLCHFLLPLDIHLFINKPSEQPFEEFILAHDLDLVLIDWHRAAERTPLKSRWIIKDLAGLYFSSKHLNLSKRDYLFFIRHYYGNNWLKKFRNNKKLWEKAAIKGEALYDKHRS